MQNRKIEKLKISGAKSSVFKKDRKKKKKEKADGRF
jgi:hypothetical protein